MEAEEYHEQSQSNTHTNTHTTSASGGDENLKLKKRIPESELKPLQDLAYEKLCQIGSDIADETLAQYVATLVGRCRSMNLVRDAIMELVPSEEANVATFIEWLGKVVQYMNDHGKLPDSMSFDEAPKENPPTAQVEDQKSNQRSAKRGQGSKSLFSEAISGIQQSGKKRERVALNPDSEEFEPSPSKLHRSGYEQQQEEEEPEEQRQGSGRRIEMPGGSDSLTEGDPEVQRVLQMETDEFLEYQKQLYQTWNELQRVVAENSGKMTSEQYKEAMRLQELFNAVEMRKMMLGFKQGMANRGRGRGRGRARGQASFRARGRGAPRGRGGAADTRSFKERMESTLSPPEEKGYHQRKSAAVAQATNQQHGSSTSADDSAVVEDASSGEQNDTSTTAGESQTLYKGNFFDGTTIPGGRPDFVTQYSRGRGRARGRGTRGRGGPRGRGRPPRGRGASRGSLKWTRNGSSQILPGSM